MAVWCRCCLAQGVVSPRTPASQSRVQGPSVIRAEHGSEQQLLEACELLLLQRCFRELLLEEFVTTLHLVGGTGLGTWHWRLYFTAYS